MTGLSNGNLQMADRHKMREDTYKLYNRLNKEKAKYTGSKPGAVLYVEARRPSPIFTSSWGNSCRNAIWQARLVLLARQRLTNKYQCFPYKPVSMWHSKIWCTCDSRGETRRSRRLYFPLSELRNSGKHKLDKEARYWLLVRFTKDLH